MIKLTSFKHWETFVDFLCANFANHTFSWFPMPYPYLEFNFYFEDKKFAVGVLIDRENQIFVSNSYKFTGLDLFEEVLKKKEVRYEKV